jgi:hypothetical protein
MANMAYRRERTVAGRPKSSSSQHRREPAKITDWIQALATVIAVVLAGWAGIIALNTYSSQLDRQDRRYASRVAWWWDMPSYGHDEPHFPLSKVHFVLQNRSPVPLTSLNVTLRRDDEYLYWDFWLYDLPPCIIATYSIDVSDPDETLSQVIESRWDADLWGLTFNDGMKLWHVNSQHQLRSDNIPHGALNPPKTSPLKEQRSMRRSVEDCGEGG